MAGLVVLSGCKGPDAPSTRLTIFAASSLTDVFQDLEREFEAQTPDVDVVIATAGSQILRFQIEQGATPDIFASAHLDHMKLLQDTGYIPEHETFGSNRLAIVVPQENPADISTVADLPKAKRIVLGTEEVPVGMYTRLFLELAHKRMGGHYRAEVSQKVASRESNVRQVLAKVELGEADAAVVYVTDATPHRRVRVISIPEALNPTANYQMGMLAESPSPVYAQRWLKFVSSHRGQTILEKHGFKVD